MSQAHPGRQIVRHRKDIPQCVNLEFVKRLVDGSLEQRLQRMQSILNFLLLGLVRFLVSVVPLFAAPVTNFCRRWDRATDVRGSLGIRGLANEAEAAGRDREQASFDGVNGAVDDSVDRIDDFINERLPGTPEGSFGQSFFAIQVKSRERGGGKRGGDATNQRGVSEVLRQELISLAIGFPHFLVVQETRRRWDFGLCVELRPQQEDATVCFILATEVPKIGA